MNWDAIGAIGEIASALILIVSIIFLSRQIRESNAHAQASAEQHVQDSWNGILNNEIGEVLETVMKGHDDFDSLSGIEKAIFVNNLGQKVNHLEMVLKMESKGLLEKETADVFRLVLTRYMSSNGSRQFWAVGGDLFQPLSTAYINEFTGAGKSNI